MALVLLAGVPEKLVKQAKAAMELLPAQILSQWSIKFFPSKIQTPQIAAADIHALMDRAAKAAGSHIVGFHQVGGQNKIAEAIRTHFRFRWGDNAILWSVASELNSFCTHLLEILTEEQKWRDNVMPTGKDSPLILPRSIFSALPAHADIWGECEMFNRELEHFEQLKKKINRFSKEHLKAYENSKATYMLDRASLFWKDCGPFHATTPFPNEWKYSHKLEEAFHFDVEHQQKREFALTDSGGNSFTIKAGKHINIDAHGYKSHGTP